MIRQPMAERQQVEGKHILTRLYIILRHSPFGRLGTTLDTRGSMIHFRAIFIGLCRCRNVDSVFGF